MEQTFFYCKSKHPEVLLKIVEQEIQMADGKPALAIITFQCPKCHHEFIYKMPVSTLKQFLVEISFHLETILDDSRKMRWLR